MKKILLYLAILLITACLNAQVPVLFSYQTIIRDDGEVIQGQTVSLLISIIKTSASGTTVYSEKHLPSTNEFGLVNLTIGNGIEKAGDLATIEWGADIYFLNVKIDIAGGTSYTDMGTTQLLSVPYALHAKTVEINDDADADPGNELQDLTIDGFNLGITNGSGVAIPSVWKRNDPDIYYDGGKVLITPSSGDVQLELADVFDAGGRNLIIGDDAYLSDIDQINTLGIFGMSDPIAGTIKLGSSGPSLYGSPSQLRTDKKLNMTNQNIVSLADPVDPQDAATKAYVDALEDKLLQLQAEVGVTDVDGYHYKTIKLGSQVWMAENLKVTKYNDGAEIAMVTVKEDWSILAGPAYCWYGNLESNKDIYGALYNWFAASSANLCPSGWHVPTDAEWEILVNYLITNGYNYDGTTTGNKIAKAMASPSGWTSSSVTGAVGNTDYNEKRNVTKFSAPAGGYRYTSGDFYNSGNFGIWWSSSGYNETMAWKRLMKYDNADVNWSLTEKIQGCSVRCVKN
jgi:uncharacterized protein (TIGR02145 family)